MKLRVFAAGTAALLMASVVLGGCGDESVNQVQGTEEEGAAVPAVAVGTPQVGEIAVSNEFIGTVSPQEQVNIIPLVTGEIASVYFEEGDQVKAGDVLMKLDDSLARIQVRSAELGKQSAEANAKRTLGSGQVLNNITMESNLKAIQHQIETVQKQYSATGDALQDSYDNKEEAEKSLKDIGSSIEAMEGEYSNIRKAVSSVTVIMQDGSYVFVYPKVPAAPTKPDPEDFGKPETGPEVSGNGIPDQNSPGTGGGQSYEEALLQYEKELEEHGKAVEARTRYDAIVKSIEAAGITAEVIGSGKIDEMLSSYQSGISSLKTQQGTLKSSVGSMESGIKSTEATQDVTESNIDFYRENLEDAKKSYAITNDQAYRDTADTLGTQIESSELNVRSARLQLDHYTLSTPIDGVIEMRNVDEYGMASAGQPAFVISGSGSMTVTFHVSESVKNALRVGDEITLVRSGDTYTAAITEISRSVDVQKGLFAVKAAANVTGDILPNGITVKIVADTFRSAEAILIPYKALYYEDEEAYVFCETDGVAVRTPVVTGIVNEDVAEITQGLTADSRVITSWSSQLTDGAAVRAVEEMP